MKVYYNLTSILIIIDDKHNDGKGHGFKIYKSGKVTYNQYIEGKPFYN